MSEQFKRYLGDSVYANFDGYMIVLTTENGIDPNNTIYLEPSVLDRLDNYREWLIKEQSRAAQELNGDQSEALPE